VISVIQAGAIPTSVFETAGSGIMVYPNPVSGILTIDYKDENVRYFKIINTYGSVVSTEKAAIPVQQFDFSKYSKGLYILEFVGSGGETVRLKVVNY
jgi:hypothetical protein